MASELLGRGKTQITSGIGPFIERRSIERKAWIQREQFPTRGDKATRAASIRGRMALIGLHVPADAPWLPDLRAELLAFPTGRHHDQVDALGLCGQFRAVALRQPDLRVDPTLRSAYR